MLFPQKYARLQSMSEQLSIRPLDLCNPGEREPNQFAMVKRFASQLVPRIKELLIKSFKIEPSIQYQVSRCQYLSGIQDGDYCCHIIDKKHSLSAAISISTAALQELAEIFFGGNSLSSNSARQISQTEIRLARRIANNLLEEISLGEWIKLDFSLAESAERGIALGYYYQQKFSIQLGSLNFNINLYWPAELFSVLDEKPYTASQSIAQVEPLLEEVTVKLNSVLSEKQISLSQLTNLKVGDVLLIPSPGVVDVLCGHKSLYKGQIVDHSGEKSLQIKQNLTIGFSHD